MLAFFRKYQKFFFFITAIVIIFSFAFFGTYQAMVPNKRAGEDELYCKTLDGKKVTTFQHRAMVYFLTISQGNLGNIFNDGVIEKDFLENELGTLFVEKFKDQLVSDFQERREKEKRFVAYSHPDDSNLSAEKVWNEFAPEIVTQLKVIKEQSDENIKDIFKAKAKLYLAERKFPAHFLQKFIAFQLQQRKNLYPDQKLIKGDLQLFGYKDIKDWFGSQFVDGVAEVIFQGAAFARERGYKISRDEVMADLFCKSEEAYQSLKSKIGDQVANSRELYRKALMALQLDEPTLLKLWEDILLFRRLLDDVGGSSIIDSYSFDKFYSYANESVDITLFQLPVAFQFKSYEDLQKFELYLEATCDYTLNSFNLPSHSLTVDEIIKKAPELVTKDFDLEIASITKDDLAAKISVKKTWEWEVEEKNFEALKEKFPILGLQKSRTSTPEERFSILQALGSDVRDSLDAYARQLILQNNLDWIPQTLEKMNTERKHLNLSLRSPQIALAGISDGDAFITLLQTDADKLKCYTQDQEHFYSIKVNSISVPEKCSFTKAQKMGMLDKLLSQRLNGTSADTLFGPLLEKIYQKAKSHHLAKEDMTKENLGKFCPSLRFVDFVSRSKDNQEESSMEWALEPGIKVISRSKEERVSYNEALSIEKGKFSPLKLSMVHGPFYFLSQGHHVDKTLPLDKMLAMQERLGTEAKKKVFLEILNRMESLTLSQSHDS